MRRFGNAPVKLLKDFTSINLDEVMYYLYLPVIMRDSQIHKRKTLGMWDPVLSQIRMPHNVLQLQNMIIYADDIATQLERQYKYVYLSARKGWASPDNPLNRPGWHADGFGSTDLNFVWWSGPGTRFAIQEFKDISEDDITSLGQFEAQVDESRIQQAESKVLYMMDASVIHATPLIDPPGCMRQYIKISLSDHKYNLADNSHNYLFDYDWKLHKREEVRNATQQRDFMED